MNKQTTTAVEFLETEFTKYIKWVCGDPNAKEPYDVLKLFKAITKAKEMEKITENTSDGHHTFKELYDFRKAYNVALFNEWGKKRQGTFNFVTNEIDWRTMYDVHKSWKHNNGEDCLGGGWFIVVAVLPEGQITNHYKAEDWDLFDIPEEEKAKYPFDNHTSQDVIFRLTNLKPKL